MELKNIILSEINQTQSQGLYVFCHMWQVERRKEKKVAGGNLMKIEGRPLL